MIRRALFSAAGLAVVAMLCFGRDAASYVGTSAGMVKQSVKNAVPMSFEMNRPASWCVICCPTSARTCT